MKYRSIIVLFTVIALYAWYASKQKDYDPNNWTEREQKLKKLDQEMKSISDEIKMYQGHSECVSDSQCRVVGIGEKVCDKYKDFIIYSTQDAQESVLLSKIDKFNEKANQFSKLNLSSNSCGKDPKNVVCIKNICTLNGAN